MKEHFDPSYSFVANEEEILDMWEKGDFSVN